MAHRTLYKHKACMHIICNACGRGASAAKWLCDCGSAWIACQSCRPIGFQCRSIRRKRGGTSLVHNKHKTRNSIFSPSTLTDAGCNPINGPGPQPSVPPCALNGPGPHPSACHPHLTRWVSDARPFKMPKTGSQCNLQLICAPSASFGAAHSNSGAKRSLEDTGGDGRTPKMLKDLRASRGQGPMHITCSTPCIRGTGLCPMTGWTIADYCPACHG